MTDAQKAFEEWLVQQDFYDPKLPIGSCVYSAEHSAFHAGITWKASQDVKQDGWQNIDTAPIDKFVLLYCADEGIVIGFYNNDEWLADDWNGNCCDCPHEIIKPALWRPLPTPPPSEKEGG